MLWWIFLSTLSLRRATARAVNTPSTAGYFYPRSPCGERRQPQQRRGQRLVISIHALLAESDNGTTCIPRGGWKFLSTLSLRRATAIIISKLCPVLHFYPRSPCGERHGALRRKHRARLFLSTLSLRRATTHQVGVRDGKPDFYPRSPCGERRRPTARHCGMCRFLSTLSLRRATWPNTPKPAAMSYFYPRSPCGERQQMILNFYQNTAHFYPRSPCGERLSVHHKIMIRFRFLSTLSLRRATNRSASFRQGDDHFYPRSPCGERPADAGPTSGH